MTTTNRGQVNLSAAEIYEEFFLPALFQEWSGRVADAARIQPGQRVLDVACGTGVLARTVSERVGPDGHVTGLDVNQGMLGVAGRKSPHIEWREGAAEAMPFDDASFDAVVSQFGLMFFEDRAAAVHQMARVLRPGGRLAVAVWDSLDNTPGYKAMVDLVARLFGESVADGLRGPYVLGDTATFSPLFDDIGLKDVTINTLPGTARFPSIEQWVYTDIKGWVLADVLDDDQVAMLIREAARELARFVTDDGTVAFAAPAHIVTAVKRG